MLRKALWKNRGIGKLLAAFAGSLLGLIVLLYAIQLYTDVRAALDRNDLLGSGYLVINKGVSLLNTAGVAESGFYEDEIQDLEDQPFVDEAVPFAHSTFKTYMSLGLRSNLPDVRTDMFFESVPDQYLDVPEEDWQWKDPIDDVPITIYSDFLNLYNFGFAPSYNVPQISEGTISSLRLKLRVSGNGQKEDFYARIVGFSDRINAVLVPESFMEYANKRFGKEDNKRPSRIMLACNDPAHPELVTYLKDNGYQTNEEKLKNGRMMSLLNFVVVVLAGLSGLIILLALIVFLLSFQLIIAGSAEEIRLMLHLGTKRSSLMRFYLTWFTGILVALAGLTLGAVALMKSYTGEAMAERAMEIPNGFASELWMALAGVMVVFWVGNRISIGASLRKLSH